MRYLEPAVKPAPVSQTQIRSAGLKLKQERWPVIEITNPLSFSVEDWDALIEDIVDVLKRDTPFAMINDVRVGPPPSAKERKAIAKMYAQHDRLVRRNWRGTAIVTSSSVIRGAITALNWLIPPPHPAKVFSDYAEGESWAYSRLGLSVPARKSTLATG